jgi:hypothetical protein
MKGCLTRRTACFERRGRDLNPRGACTPNGFRDRYEYANLQGFLCSCASSCASQQRSAHGTRHPHGHGPRKSAGLPVPALIHHPCAPSYHRLSRQRSDHTSYATFRTNPAWRLPARPLRGRGRLSLRGSWAMRRLSVSKTRARRSDRRRGAEGCLRRLARRSDARRSRRSWRGCSSRGRGVSRGLCASLGFVRRVVRAG